MKVVFLFAVCFVSFGLKAATVFDTLYLNKGLLTTVDANTYTYNAFNNSNVYDTENERLMIGVGDSLYISVINNDLVVHGFDITNTTGYSATINPSDTVTIATQFNNEGVFIYYDNQDYPKFRYLGAAGMIVVDDFAGSQFYWNIKEHQGIWNDSLDNGFTVNWLDYCPNYFTINGKSNPAINADTIARVTGGIAQTIRIYAVNTGQSIHSLHFHGYHLNILFSSKSPNHVGREKDTFPLYSMESMILELTPDKLGEYPVHDHNLSAVSGGNLYPNGMFLTILIE